MIGGRVARHTLTVRRAPLVDDGRGNKRRDWANATESTSLGWALDAGGSAEDTTNRDGAAVAYTARGPFAADIQASDRIILFGEEYKIDGGVERQPGPTRVTSHTIMRLTHWEG